MIYRVTDYIKLRFYPAPDPCFLFAPLYGDYISPCGHSVRQGQAPGGGVNPEPSAALPQGGAYSAAFYISSKLVFKNPQGNRSRPGFT